MLSSSGTTAINIYRLEKLISVHFLHLVFIVATDRNSSNSLQTKLTVSLRTITLVTYTVILDINISFMGK